MCFDASITWDETQVSHHSWYTVKEERPQKTTEVTTAGQSDYLLNMVCYRVPLHLCVWDMLHFMLKQIYLFFLVLNMFAVYVLYINIPVKNLKWHN